MRSIKTAILGGLALAAALFIGNASAADFSFDGAGGSLGFADQARNADVEVPRAAPAAAGAHVYDFKSLYRSLGYPSPRYFGSSPDEVQALQDYISIEDPLYVEINGYLRYHPAPYDWYGIGPEAAKEIVGNIDRIFKNVPAIAQDAILFRGLGLGYRDNKPFTEGEEFIDKGYTSTSVSYSVARYFAVDKNDEDKPTRRAIFAIYLSRPERGILIDQGEDEVMFPHGLKFRVMARKEGVKKYDLYLVQLCAAACDTTLRADVKDFWSSFTVTD